MTLLTKNKLKHDFLNSIIIINNVSKSAEKIIHKIENTISVPNTLDNSQVRIFINSMNIIREQTSKIEEYFEVLMNNRA